MGHVGLDFLDARGCCVFSGFGVVVEEVWGAGKTKIQYIFVYFGFPFEGWKDGWDTYSVSSGRDMMGEFETCKSGRADVQIVYRSIELLHSLQPAIPPQKRWW